MPKPTRTRRTLPALGTLAAVLALTAATTPQPIYQGTGWRAFTAGSVYSLAPDTYSIVFADTTARTKLTPYLTAPATQVTTQVGVKVIVTTTIDTTPTGSCPPRHRIIVHYGYRPTGTTGMSTTSTCYNTADHSVWGAHIRMDSEYWTATAWFSSTTTVNDARRKDAVTHELGHALGLAHPNTDLNKDGKIADGECVKNKAGLRPILCSPNRGNPPVTEGGKFTTEFDLPGLRQMLANYSLRQN